MAAGQSPADRPGSGIANVAPKLHSARGPTSSPKEPMTAAAEQLTERQIKQRKRKDISGKLLDAAEELILEEGYAAATARNIARKIGLKHQAVFYYYGTQDELLLAVLRRVNERRRKAIENAFGQEHPLSTLWKTASEPEMTRLTAEFMALANHNELIRDELAKDGTETRLYEAEEIKGYLERIGVKPQIPPIVVAILTHSMAIYLRQEKNLGIKLGHDLAEFLTDASFAAFEKSTTSSESVRPIVEGLTAPRSDD